MKKYFVVLTGLMLLMILIITGCKKGPGPVVFTASEQILGYWETESDVIADDFTVLAGANIHIYYNSDGGSFDIDVDYYADIGEDEPEDCWWWGIISPDPTTSAYCSISVIGSYGSVAPNEDSVVSIAYDMLDNDTATIYFDGDAFNVVRRPMD